VQRTSPPTPSYQKTSSVCSQPTNSTLYPKTKDLYSTLILLKNLSLRQKTPQGETYLKPQRDCFAQLFPHELTTQKQHPHYLSRQRVSCCCPHKGEQVLRESEEEKRIQFIRGPPPTSRIPSPSKNGGTPKQFGVVSVQSKAPRLIRRSIRPSIGRVTCHRDASVTLLRRTSSTTQLGNQGTEMRFFGTGRFSTPGQIYLDPSETLVVPREGLGGGSGVGSRTRPIRQ